MASITIRNLDEATKRSLRMRAAEHGWSMEEEVRRILREAVTEPAPKRDLVKSIRARVDAVGGVELEPPAREAMRDPVRFD